jgi:hypothetical protein
VLADNLISKVARHLPQEIDASRGQRWDEVLVNRYLCDVREAKKQGRKERRHKEAQAVLAAATAAAAASSRTSSFRKDALDESAHQEVVFFSISLLYIFSFSLLVFFPCLLEKTCSYLMQLSTLSLLPGSRNIILLIGGLAFLLS